MMISKADLDKYGYDDECPQCQHVRKYDKGKQVVSTPNGAELGS